MWKNLTETNDAAFNKNKGFCNITYCKKKSIMHYFHYKKNIFEKVAHYRDAVPALILSITPSLQDRCNYRAVYNSRPKIFIIGSQPVIFHLPQK